jgi:hypothetical protein
MIYSLKNVSFYIRIACVLGALCFSAGAASADTAPLSNRPPQVIHAENSRQSTDKNLKSFRKVEKELVTMTDGGGSLTAYYDKANLIKVQSWIGLSNKNVIDDFYYRNGALLLVVETEWRFIWDKQRETMNLTRTERASRNRYYFNAGQLSFVRKSGSKSIRPTNQDEKREIGKRLLELSGRFVKAAASPARSIELQ